ncbi:enoyl-CoA hydratase [Tranquillimonas rosea]|uniref:3-hydroxyisobutyryl-CoA hydrolase n=1 Tax=Tranquillimonas rosea TaxID=641238 RepID=A0A1H9V684_9RHOB|nr:enoyl-CoA hydratase/isomerase family protein [Tranquillimonas rosea]SES17266.1 enoyl-CoA hydratase [Tranquillimonas rosea]
MTDLNIRTDGHAGRITLTRPKALNALTHDMSLEIEAALDAWAEDESVRLIVIDAEGDRAFCAGGDIAYMYHSGRTGDFAGPRAFWRDEYRMNRKIARHPKPVVALMQGYVMGGGVGIGCHAAHRVVGETTKIAMPECAIGLVPDVGGSLLLARAPGRLGEYLGLTGTRMGPADALRAGFADAHVPQEAWRGLTRALCDTGDISAIAGVATDPGRAELAAVAGEIDHAFEAHTLSGILDRLDASGTPFAKTAEAELSRGSPLSAATTLELIRRSREAGTIEAALELEYRCTWRCIEQGDLIEGVRAQIIDKDRAPIWKHGDPRAVTHEEVAAMLAPLDNETREPGETA